MSRAEAILPLAARNQVAQVRLGVRAMPADGLTVSGFVDPAQRVYVVATHCGVTLAPLLGELSARELHGETVALLGAFRPDRFGDHLNSQAAP